MFSGCFCCCLVLTGLCYVHHQSLYTRNVKEGVYWSELSTFPMNLLSFTTREARANRDLWSAKCSLFFFISFRLHCVKFRVAFRFISVRLLNWTSVLDKGALRLSRLVCGRGEPNKGRLFVCERRYGRVTENPIFPWWLSVCSNVKVENWAWCAVWKSK